MLSVGANDRQKTSSSSLHVSFSVGAVAIIALSVTITQMSTFAVDMTAPTDLPVHARHRRALSNDTVPHENDTVLINSADNDTVLDWTTRNGSVLNDLQLSGVSHSVTTTRPSTSTVVTVTLSKTRPQKPQYLDASKLNQDRHNADGSKFRHEIRKNLGNVPPEDKLPAVPARPQHFITTLLTSVTVRVPASITAAPANQSVASNSSSVLMSAHNVSSSASSSSVTLQKIMRELESLMTSDQHPSVMTNSTSISTSTSTSNASSHISTGSSTAASSTGTSISTTTSGSSSTIVATPSSSSTSSAGSSSSSSAATSTSTAASSTSSTSSLRHLPLPTSPLSQAVTTSPTSVSTTVRLSTSSLSPAASTFEGHHVSSRSSSSCDIILLTVASVCLSVAVLFAAVSMFSTFQTPRPSSSYHQYTLSVFIAAALLHFFQSAVEWTFTSLVVELTSSMLSWHRMWSVSLLLVYWVCFTIGRVLCKFVVVWIRPWPVLFLAELLSSVAGLIMLAGLLQYSSSTQLAARDALVWMSSALLGLSTSVVLPTTLKYIPSTVSLSVIVTVGAGLGEAAVPCLSASLSEVYSDSYIMTAVFTAALGALGVTVLLKCLTTRSSGNTTVSSTRFHLLDSTSMEELNHVIQTSSVDEEAELLSPVDMETSLVTPSSLPSFIKNISGPTKND